MASIPRKEKFRWPSYTYRYKNPEFCKKFGEWLLCKDWSDVVQATGSDRKTELYQSILAEAVDNFSPLRSIRRKNTEPPWINATVKRLIKARKRIFKDTGGRTKEWKTMKKKVDKLIKKRRKIYQDSQRETLLAADASRNFFRSTKNYMSKQRPTPFDVMDLFPGRTEQDVSELLADHFNSVSNEFSPLQRNEIPTMYSADIPALRVHEVAIRLKKFKKPKSLVKGDIFPELVTRYADLLAVPLTSIYNEITNTAFWSKIWKEEFVTIIPKTRTPADIGQLRNISCTMLASKVYESLVLEWASSQVKLKPNQFGGTKGCSTSHLLISVWQRILSDLEDCRAATLLTAIDYSKAFNRMQFQECLKSFARHGASTELIAIIATFLSDRIITIRVGNCWSRKRAVNGGVPQGSILGVLLFNMTTDNLEDEADATGIGQSGANEQGRPECGRAASTPPVQELDDSDSDSDSSLAPDWTASQHMASTPAKQDAPELDISITPFRRSGSDFVFLDNARNIKRAMLNDPNLTMLKDQTIPLEKIPPTSAVWRPRKAGFHKYIDDGIADSKLNTMEGVPQSEDGRRVKHAIASQNLFHRVVRNATTIGMRVNSSKTNQICVSDSLAFKADVYIQTNEGEILGTSNEMRILGFYFSDQPNCNRHIDSICKSFRGKYWLLIHLRQNYFTEEEMIRAYTAIIRPIAEYCAPVFHSMINDRQDEILERLQATALRYVYGYGVPYAKMRERANIETLRARRISLCDKFVQKCLASERFSEWFPENDQSQRSRHTLQFREEFARCDRLKNSPSST